MVQYLIKRILIFIPTLLVISLLAFGLSKCAPGDPLESMAPPGGESQWVNKEKVYRERAKLLGLDKPPFYFALSPAAFPDTLHLILKKDQRRALKDLVSQYGNWPAIENYYHSLQTTELKADKLSSTGFKDNTRRLTPNVKQLLIAHKDARIKSLIDDIETVVLADSILNDVLYKDIVQLKENYDIVKNQTSRYLLYIPDIKWYGWDNQYHNWFSNFLKFDFGISYKDGRPVATLMKEGLFWTIILNVLAITLAYMLSIPLGVFSAIWKNSTFDRLVSLLLFILYSLPSFWIATMLVVFFTTPEYGMDWFPSLGTGELPPSASLGARFKETAYHLILPVFCLTYGALAFISRQIRGGMLAVIRQDYIRTAWAKGLDSRLVIWKHAFRNALFPIITMIASIIPAVFAGSVVIEVIFNIPGMGKLTVDAIFQRNWPVVYTTLMLSATLTMIGILLADILYALVDPRVSYSLKKR